MKKMFFFFMLFLIGGCANKELQEKKLLGKGFVYLSHVDQTIIENTRYATEQNFTGKRVPGYEKKRIICTQKAAEQLKKANSIFKQYGYKLVVYDGYRPQKAVDSFRVWGEKISDDSMKKYYYPTLQKKDLFNLGYIDTQKSSHSRGSTFDVTIIEVKKNVKPIVIRKRQLKNGDQFSYFDDNTVDMGSSFDLFHQASNHDSPLISLSYAEKRNLLRKVMKKAGFDSLQKKWWSYTLQNEPYPDTYFDFDLVE